MVPVDRSVILMLVLAVHSYHLIAYLETACCTGVYQTTGLYCKNVWFCYLCQFWKMFEISIFQDTGWTVIYLIFQLIALSRTETSDDILFVCFQSHISVIPQYDLVIPTQNHVTSLLQRLLIKRVQFHDYAVTMTTAQNFYFPLLVYSMNEEKKNLFSLCLAILMRSRTSLHISPSDSDVH